MRRDRGDEKQVGDVRCVPAHKSEMKSPVICEGFKRIVCASKMQRTGLQIWINTESSRDRRTTDFASVLADACSVD